MSYSCSHKYFPDLQLFTMMIYIGAFAVRHATEHTYSASLFMLVRSLRTQD